MKREGLFVLLVFVILSQIITADVISVNSGGSEEIVINPDTYVEGFFSDNGVQVLSTCGNDILETPYEECDDGNTVSGDGCSSTCQDEEGPEEPEEPEEPVTPTGELGIRVDPNEIKRSMLINTNVEDTIGITNLNLTSSTIFIYSSDFHPDLIVSFWDEEGGEWTDSFSLTIPPRGIHELRIRFSAPGEVGIYNGTIFIAGIRVPVSINIQEKLILFDSNIIVLNEDYRVPQGERLRTSVTLIPLGDKERMDVTLNYIIKDYEGKVYLTRSETVLVEEQVNFKRNFDTGVLPYGSYIVSLELIYPNGVAPSSAHFEVVEGTQSTLFGRIVFFLINMILIILILIIFLVIWRLIKQVKERNKKGEKYFNLVITGAEKKGEMLDSFFVSCKGKDNSELLEIGKVDKGIKEKLEEGAVNLERLNELLKPLVLSEKENDIKIKPSLVVEVSCTGIQKSSEYVSGWELKSPKITWIKENKRLSDISKLSDIEKEFSIKKEEFSKKEVVKEKENVVEKEKSKGEDKPKEEDKSKTPENPKK
jgi:cysteine-rich repeat protein